MATSYKRALLACLLAFILLAAAGNARAAGIRIVVNSSNGIPSITKAKVADLFLKRVTRWDNGRAITPVDLADKNASRAEFSKQMLGKEVAWVKSYWQKMIFSGRATPPAELSSDTEVLQFVRANPDAIGYVSETATLSEGVKAVPVTE